jgi:CDP-glucose 4,6-dehydratase
MIFRGMQDFWSGRRVLLTGHTGFKGSWLSLWLTELGACVGGIALPESEPGLWSMVRECGVESQMLDIRDAAALREAVARFRPDIVIHLAAQSLVRASYRDPLGTYGTNVMGTANLLQACRDLAGLAAILVVTSDKVYENHGAGRPFGEDDRLGGHDPYSNSKACAELVTQSFRDSFFAAGPPIATARAGNVVGGGDWAADRIIPDCVRALDAGEKVRLRYADAVRPWQHVLEPLCGYLTLAEALARGRAEVPLAVNFGPDPHSFCSVRAVVEGFSARFNGRPCWVRDAGAHPPEAAALTLASDLAGRSLGWRPRLDLEATLAWTAEWYRAQRGGEDMLAFSRAQIRRYQELAGMEA